MSVSYIYQLEIENKRLKEKLEKINIITNWCSYGLACTKNYQLLHTHIKEILNGS